MQAVAARESSSAPPSCPSSWTKNNQLSEITHKRPCTALGPGGLTRGVPALKSLTYTQRITVAYSIEKPEGPNIGLINSFWQPILCPYQTSTASGKPVRVVSDAQVTDEIIFLSCDRRHPITYRPG